GCDEAVSQLLWSHGYVIVPRDARKGIYGFIAIAGPRAVEIFSAGRHRSPEEILAQPALCQPVTTVVKLQTINGVVAANALRPFFSQAGNQGPSLVIGCADNNGALLLSGLQNRVADAILLLRKADGQDESDGQPAAAPAQAPDLPAKLAAL